MTGEFTEHYGLKILRYVINYKIGTKVTVTDWPAAATADAC